MTPTLVLTRFGPARPDRPLVVLGPSLGTSAATLWAACAAHLDDVEVVAWDLPGHGRSPVADGPLTAADLAAGVLAALEPERPFVYAGDSVGGVVGQQLLLDAPDRVTAAVLLCTGARLGTPESWAERIAQAESSGTPSLVVASAARWFGNGFLEREPAVGSALLHALSDADDRGYAQVCGVLAGFDARHRLGEITAPVLAVAGAEDPVAPPSLMSALAEGVADGRLVVLDGVGHLAPAEAPERVSELIRAQVARGDDPTLAGVRAAGTTVRRAVLGDAHVDRAVAGTTELTADFQDLITAYAWGSIWTRPGLDRRSRSMITLTALIARGHHEELEMHLRAARRNGLTWDEIGEVLLQSSIYLGVPDANTAFRIASRVRTEEESHE